MLIATAVGLGSIDMPIPQVATWEWVSWKFPKAVRAGDTIYARWTLTQKRPPVHGAKTGIVVWRVDVHTLDGAMVAEGEIGAAIVRRGSAAAVAERQAEAAAGPPRRRRRGRRGSGQAEVATAPAPAPAPQPEIAALVLRAQAGDGAAQTRLQEISRPGRPGRLRGEGSRRRFPAPAVSHSGGKPCLLCAITWDVRVPP